MVQNINAEKANCVLELIIFVRTSSCKSCYSGLCMIFIICDGIIFLEIGTCNIEIRIRKAEQTKFAAAAVPFPITCSNVLFCCLGFQKLQSLSNYVLYITCTIS